jgi:hypothetical protein
MVEEAPPTKKFKVPMTEASNEGETVHCIDFLENEGVQHIEDAGE